MSMPTDSLPYPGYPFVTYRFFPTTAYVAEHALPRALDLIVQSIGGECEDELFYNYMLNIAPMADRDIITSIRDDERKHNLLLRELHWEITGREAPSVPEGQFQEPRSYCEGITSSIFGELSAVERYREVLFGLEFLPYRNILTQIYTDELKHATKWNYLFALNYR